MKFSTKIILSLIVLLGLSAIYSADNYFSKKSEEKKESLSRGLYFNSPDVLQFAFKNKSGSYRFEREDEKKAHYINF